MRSESVGMAGLTRPTGYGAEQRRGLRIDWFLVLATCLLITIGLMSLYSEGLTRDGGAIFRTQIRNTVIGIVPFSIFAFTPTRIWLRIAGLTYGLNALMLAAVLVVGVRINGAERWLKFGPIVVQPSELAKLLLVLTLSAFYARRLDSITKPSTFWMSGLHVSVPMLLVLLQPHLGAALVMIVTWFAISLVVGIPTKYLAFTAGGLVLLMGLLVVATKIPSAPKFMRSYQIQRLLGMTSNDSKGKNYQTEQAEVAFGLGGAFGEGFLHGERKAGHFVPEQDDDFIFTVVGEEGGLIGCTLVLAAFGFFFYRLWLVMLLASDPYPKMIVGGLFAALGFHMFVNMGMVLHILPVVGLWLPFLSYGGSAMWMCMSAVGLALQIRSREKPILF